MFRSRLVAISGVSSAIALLCLVTAGYIKWLAVIVAAIAAVAVSIPLLISSKHLVYSLLCYLASSVLGCVLGFANIAYVVIIAAFAMPFAMFKCFAESRKDTKPAQKDGRKSQSNLITPPDKADAPFSEFGGEQPKETRTAAPAAGVPRVKPFIKWIVYFAICEVAIGLTIGAMYLFVPALIDSLIASKLLYIAIAALNAAVPLYNFMLNAAFQLTRNALRKSGMFK